MLHAVLRKGRQLANDPVLRRWLLARALGRTPAEPAFSPHRPPYLGPDWAGLPLEPPIHAFARLGAEPPPGWLRLHLAGESIDVDADAIDALFQRDFPDLETRLSLHRFAWLPLAPEADPRFLAAIWAAWARRFGTPDNGWAWHPYTAAERAINILTFAQRHGLPEGAAELLAAHAPIIAAGLEWFGDHHTSNHCANNGRGLYLLGLALGLPKATEAGAAILLNEARRIFAPSGVLREASTHYHLLLTRQWASIWLAAKRYGRPEEAEFRATLERALAVLPRFVLGGGLPLMGDISPDCPPEHLFGLLPGGNLAHGWTGLLAPDDQAALAGLRDAQAPAGPTGDGWLRLDAHGWSGLWHAEPLGWSPMPGHGHQDCGAPELHFEDEAIFIDPGRGSYALAGEADAMVQGAAHGGLLVDGADPYPPNRPYYAPQFRAAQAAGAVLEAGNDSVSLSHGGYGRLGVAELRRTWRFSPKGFMVDDSLTGRGRHHVIRQLVTPLDVRPADNGFELTSPRGRRFRVSVTGAVPDLRPAIRHVAYGVGRPAQLIRFTSRASLPWSGRLVVEVL
jgi:hypothetical protein